jgi:hypothetical protein
VRFDLNRVLVWALSVITALGASYVALEDLLPHGHGVIEEVHWRGKPVFIKSHIVSKDACRAQVRLLKKDASNIPYCDAP